MATYQWTAPTGTDPVEDGGSVGQLVLRHLLGDDFTTAHTVAGPATKVDEGVYEWVLPAALVESRYWPQVTYDPDGTGDVTVDQPAVDLPGWEVTGRIVTPWSVAVELGLALPLTDLQTARLADRITQSQAKVGDYLNRPLLPTERTFTGRAPVVGYDLLDAAAWPDIKRESDDTISVVSATLVDFSYTVVVDVGLNAATDPRLQAIRDWVIADAAAQLQAATGDARMGSRDVTSVSADGQSVSYQQGGSSGGDKAGMAGGVADLSSLRRWRRLPVYQRATYATPPWPYARTP